MISTSTAVGFPDDVAIKGNEELLFLRGKITTLLAGGRSDQRARLCFGQNLFVIFVYHVYVRVHFVNLFALRRTVVYLLELKVISYILVYGLPLFHS